MVGLLFILEHVLVDFVINNSEMSAFLSIVKNILHIAYILRSTIGRNHSQTDCRR